jgi:hypothetical protein
MRNYLLILCLSIGFTALAQTVQLHWVGDAPAVPAGTSWGVPFEKGKVAKEQHFVVTTAANGQHPVQSWPLAFWPDGSVKWMGFAASGLQGTPLLLQASEKPLTGQSLTVRTTGNQTIISHSNVEYRLNNSGTTFLETAGIGGKELLRSGKLIASLYTGKPESGSLRRLRELPLTGTIEQLTVEQSGPVRAVVRLNGQYRSPDAKRSLFPFTLRLYFYQGISTVQMTHSFVYDGDQETDFIGSMGVEFAVPFREALYNRHVGFTTAEGGIWREAVQPLVTRYPLRLKGVGNVAMEQAAGTAIPAITPDEQPAYTWVQHLPSWNNYKLTQLHPGGYTIQKQTQSRSSWLQATTGSRSNGAVLAGDVSGSVLLAMKDFWQSFPASMEITEARGSQAIVRSWFWSPDAEPMDLRHYDTIAHDLDATYEDVQPGLSTPYGVGRTHELTLFIGDTLPSSAQLTGMAAHTTAVSRLMPVPAYLHRVRAFGTWSLPDYTNPTRRWMESQLDSAFHFYQRAVEEHQWYGFWNYGDVMHSYDPSRHSWKYDIGGYAWANTELAPNNWLWYSFLRTGRADIFRMAEAMTRHTGEVDAYHIGPMKGLGTRHNVSHWGCGAKEARIGQASWKRFYYYLTTDERSGDLMREALDVEKAMMEFEPLRIAQPKEKFPYGGPTRLRWGPDWLALAGNWMTEWERTGNTVYRDKLITGLNGLAALPDGLFTGPNGLSYDPATGKLWYDGKEGVTNKNHLATIMGGFELLTELKDMIDHPVFTKSLVEYGKYYSMPADDPQRTAANRKLGDINFLNPRMTAYAAAALNDSALAARAWNEFLYPRFRPRTAFPSIYGAVPVQPPVVHTLLHENPWVSTNSTSQWGLNAIILPELIGNFLPDSSFQQQKKTFGELKQDFSKLIFRDRFRTTKNWFTDGKKLKLTTNRNRLLFDAGPTPASDADHSVLWSVNEYSGDLKIEFDYVRRDYATRYVTILYLFAQGSGVTPYETDISRWNSLREIPAMKQYFTTMNLFHVSFAAFENDNHQPDADYIRARRYRPLTGKGLAGTDLQPEYLNTGFFEPGVRHHLTLIRKQDTIWMEVKTESRVQLYHWTSPEIESLQTGRIGIRLMGSRSAEISDFRIYKQQ